MSYPRPIQPYILSIGGSCLVQGDPVAVTAEGAPPSSVVVWVVAGTTSRVIRATESSTPVVGDHVGTVAYRDSWAVSGTPARVVHVFAELDGAGGPFGPSVTIRPAK